MKNSSSSNSREEPPENRLKLMSDWKTKETTSKKSHFESTSDENKTSSIRTDENNFFSSHVGKNLRSRQDMHYTP